MNKKILITGANGFLGSAITRLALKKNYKVNVLVRKNTNLKNLEKISSKINQEEIFGPVVTLIPFKNESEANKIANDTKYGLSATVWSEVKVKSNRVSKAKLQCKKSVNKRKNGKIVRS